jgi:ABC-type dipeptide/oligopeptide/nickel transport system, ATPase component
LEKILFENFSARGTCKIFHHDSVKECIQDKSFEIYAGMLNGVVGEYGNEKAAISCSLTGNVRFNGDRISVDDKEETIDYIIKNSWYIVYDIYGSHSPLFRRKTKGEPLYYEYNMLRRRKTIKEQIETGVQENRCDLNANTIQEMFELLESRLGRSINYVSGARWKSSIAIGYAYGKKIFCYPWMNSKDVRIMEEQIRKNIEILTDNNCFVVFPTTKEENIKKLATKYNIIYLD